MNVGRLPSADFGAIIRAQSDSYTITRVTGMTTDASGYVTETTSTHNEDIYLFDPSAISVQSELGERMEGDLMGRALPSADLQEDDRLNHGGVKYEIVRLDPLPSASQEAFKSITLERVQS